LSVRLVISLRSAPGKGAEFGKLFAERCREVQKEPGCLQFEVFQSQLDPDGFTLLELWADQAALDVHAEHNAAAPLTRRWRRCAGRVPASAKTTSTTGRGSYWPRNPRYKTKGPARRRAPLRTKDSLGGGRLQALDALSSRAIHAVLGFERSDRRAVFGAAAYVNAASLSVA